MNHRLNAAPRLHRHLQTAREQLFVRCSRRVRRALGWHLNNGHRVAFTRLAWVAAAAFSSAPALATPEGAQVAAGQVTVFSSVPGTLNIQQSTPKAIINWRSFNIASGETVNFLQPSADSVTLNRVLGNDPSAIFGRLSSTGTVLLVNPNGVVFGPTARLDVGGLVATTANIRDDAFMAGRYHFGEVSSNPQARIVNAGEISIREGGLAALVAPSVHNSGVIQARLGRVMLGGASRFTLDFQGDGLLSFAAGAAAENAQVINTGTLQADGGTVLLSTSAVKGVVDQVINTRGVISATSVSGSNGRIVLAGGDSGTVAVSGSLLAGAAPGGSAPAMTGGQIIVNGQHVQLSSSARLDVSGAQGGGEIAIGSDGVRTGYTNRSLTTTVAEGARLTADALTQGNGGHITLWSTDTTRFAGQISARGGAAGGNGGFAEVSSEKNIGLTGQVDLRAPRGQAGLLLLDPTDLRITDTASGASQDGNASDGTVAAGDANQGAGNALNTVSRGLLESLSGTANIVLQATGEIIVDAMAGGLINLATTAGHGFTLQSTQGGGIRFADAGTEIRTQGGAINLLAQGINGRLTQTGKLSSQGGAITLTASGDIELAGALNAGSGAIALQSTVGSISNAAGSSPAPLLTGSAINLSAAAGHVGSATSAINTRTADLSIHSGGHLVASSDTALTRLALTNTHLTLADANALQVTAPGLTFQVSDGPSVAVDLIRQTAGLDLSFSSDRTLQLGTVNVGAGNLTLSSTGASLLGSADTALTAGSAVLLAQGSTGAIGSAGQALLTAATRMDARAGSGGIHLANTGALQLERLTTTANSSATATGTLTLGHLNVDSANLSLGSGGGSIVDDGNAATRISAHTLQLTAGGAIGAVGTRLQTTASTVSASAAVGGVYLNTSATGSVLSSIESGNGAIAIGVGGTSTLTSLISGTSGAANSINVTATGPGSMTVGSINAGALGDVTLTTQNGSITGTTGLITGDTVTLNVLGGSVNARTAASHLAVQAGSGNITINQTGSVTLDNLSTTGSTVAVTASSGDITVGNLSTASSGSVNLTATAGRIQDDGNSSTRISTGSATLSAEGAIGSASHAVQTRATSLTAGSTGDLYISNIDSPLTSLSLTNRHTAPGTVNTLQLTSPYLSFDVTDNGSQYNLTRLVGQPLTSLSFNGDQTLALGHVQSAGLISLTATQGSIVDDGSVLTRVNAPSGLTMSATQGGIGSLSNPIGVNASTLSLTTRGDLVVSSLVDLTSLTIDSRHPDATTSYAMAVTAPLLRFNVSDSAAGHQVHTITDLSSLTLNFTSDRDITLGQVNASVAGTVRFTSSAGNLLDDGDKSSTVLANSTTLSGLAVGASGTGHLDVVTGTLNATASAGGVYIKLPMPTGSTNSTSTVSLGTVTAAGPIAVTASEGDLSVQGTLNAGNNPIQLTATQGAILAAPSGASIVVGSGTLGLNASKGIGTAAAPVVVTSTAGGALDAQAGTAMFVSGNGPLTLSNLGATAGITHTQASGDVTLGNISATSGSTVSISASNGAILDDNNGATRVTGSQVTLSSALGAVGSPGSPVAVNTSHLAITALGDVAVSGNLALDSLSMTRGSGSTGSLSVSTVGGQAFTLAEDASGHLLQSINSPTPLAFSFAGQRAIKVGQIDVGAAGSVNLSSAGDISHLAPAGGHVAAGTVTLTAGSTGSVGSSGNAIALQGTTNLTASAGRDIHAASDTALTHLTLTSTNTDTAIGSASVFGLSALGQTFNITDTGTTQTLDISGTALTNFAFTNSKNIQAVAITVTQDLSLTTSGGGANANISSDNGTGGLLANRVLLSASSDTAGGGSVGSFANPVRMDAPTAIITSSANVHLDNAQNLTTLDMMLSHGTSATNSYGISAGNISSFSVTDGSTQSLGMAVSGAMAFSYSVDRALSLGTVDVGTSSTGSISLTSRSAPTGTNARINRGSGSITAGTVSLTAVGTNGGVGADATLSSNTQNLSIASGGNVSVSNSTTLTSLSIDAQHRSTTSTSHSYSLSSTGLSFSISDSTGSTGLQLINISQSGLDLSIKADRLITAATVNTGVGGRVSLTSSDEIRGSGSNAITTGDLSLTATSVSGPLSNQPLFTVVSSLSSNVSSSLRLSNTGNLTLRNNTVGDFADVSSSSGSLVQAVGGLFTAPVLKLSGFDSVGVAGAPLLTNTRHLTLVSGRDLILTNSADLYTLAITSNHRLAGVQNTVVINADRLAMSLTDSVGGNQYSLANLTDASGLDFRLRTDVELNLGNLNAQAGRSLSLSSTGVGTSITSNGSSLLRASSVSLSATGSVGAAGGASARLQTDALGLTIATAANALVDNAQDLSSLSLTSNQGNAGGTPTFHVTAPALNFDVTDIAGTTRINTVTDSTGLNFTLSTVRSHSVGELDVSPSGTVTLSTSGDILGDTDAGKRIRAASATLMTEGGGSMGSVAHPVRMTVPLARFDITGAFNVESDTHIARLHVASTHPVGMPDGGTYSLVSVPMTGGSASSLFSALDDANGTRLTSLSDPLGLSFTFTSDRTLRLGSLNLGTTGTVSLTSNGYSILEDGNPATQVRAATLDMVATGGALGAIGAGNSIEATVHAMSASAMNGGVNLSLHGRTNISTLLATGAVNLVNDTGDLALGMMVANGYAVTVHNQGGSILSGRIAGSSAVTLHANGSIGNQSALETWAIFGGTTSLTATASAANGATGSVAISEGYALVAGAVSAPGAIRLQAGLDLVSHFITSTGGAVSLQTNAGNLEGLTPSSLVTGTSVDLRALSNTANGVGTGGASLRVATPQLTVNSSRNIYVTSTSDLSHLTIDRGNYTATSSSGVLSVAAPNLTFTATDTANTTTLTTVNDSTGLNFSYSAVGSLAIGNVNVGSGGSVFLRSNPSSGSGNIDAVDGTSLITAGSLTMESFGTSSRIGSSATPLGLAVSNLSVLALHDGGIHLQQAGPLNLASLSTSGSVSVNTSAGDLTLGSLSYGDIGGAATLTLAASGGRILSSGNPLMGATSNAAITLSARDGIGTETAPVLVNGQAGHTVTASVTGTGDLHLNSLAALNGGLVTAVQDGATRVTAAGAIKLTSMSTGSDAPGHDISVTASAGDITVGNVSGGASANHNAVHLAALSGSIIAATPSSLVEAFDIRLHGGIDVGSAAARLPISGQRVQATTALGSIELRTAAPSAIASLDSPGGAITVVTANDLMVANARSGAGILTVSSNTNGVDLVLGNLQAGISAVEVESTAVNGSVLDDGNRNTLVSGPTVILTAGSSLGTASRSLQTRTSALVASAGTGVYIDDHNASGVALGYVGTATGSVAINTAGPTIATLVETASDASGHNVSINSGGDLTLTHARAGLSQGAVHLSSGGSILGSGAAAHVVAHSASLSAGADIGVVTDPATGAGTPLLLDIERLTALNSSGSNRSVSVRNLIPLPLTLDNNAISMGSGGSAYIVALGDLDLSAGLNTNASQLQLTSGAVLILPTTALTSTGHVRLEGALDVFTNASGAAGRNLQVNASSLVLRSGAALGDTLLTTQVGSIDASLSGAGALSVVNTGTLSSATLATTDGDISATSSTGMTAGSVVTGGASRQISLTATAGDLVTGTVHAGSDGSITLSAAQGALNSVAASLTASTLDMTSGQSIGSSGAAFGVTAGTVRARVTGSGGIHLSSASALALDNLTTQDGDISVTAAGHLNAASLTAGSSGNVALSSTAGNVTLTQAYTQSGSDSSRAGLSLSGQQLNVLEATTTGAQSYIGDLALGGNLSARALSVSGSTTLGTSATLSTTQALSLGGALLGGGHAATLNGSSVVLGGAASGLAGLSITAGSIQVGNVSSSGAQSYQGATSLNGNYSTGGAAFTVGGAAQLGGATTVNTAGGSVGFSGTVDGAAALSLNTGAGDAVFAAALGNSTRLGALNISSAGATQLGGTVSAASVVTDAAGTLAVNGGSINTTGQQSFGERLVLGSDLVLTASTVNLAQGADAAAAGQQGLSVVGSALLPSAMGGQAALKHLNITGDTALNGGTVTTTGTQSYGGALTLGTNTVLTGNGISITGTTNGATSLTVAAGQGGASFGGAVGNTTALAAVTTQGSSPSTLAGPVTTSGAQAYGGAVTLAGDAVLAGSSVSIGGALNGSHNLVINSSGLTQLSGPATLASITTDAAGSLALNGGSITTTGAQSFGERAVLGSATTLNGSNVTLLQGAQGPALTIVGNTVLGGDVTTTGAQSYSGTLNLLGDTVLAGGSLRLDGSLNSAHALTLNSSGATVINGAVQTASLATDTAGSLAINGGSITTTGAQSFGERAVLGSATTLNGSNVTLLQGAQGPALTIVGNTVLGGDVTTTGAQSYGGTLNLLGDTVLAGGSLRFDGSLNSAHALTLNSSGATVINGAVQAASLATDTAGSLAINGGSITTTGAQSFGERAVLGSATTLNGSNVTLLQGAQGPALTIVGNTVLGGDVTTTGAQSYGGTLNLLGDTVLAGGSLRFDGSLNSAHALTLNSSGATVINGAVQTASLATDTAGSLAINGGSITTTGAQSFGERAVLGSVTTLNGSNVTLLQGAQGPALSITGNAGVAGEVATTGAQTYGAALQLLGDTVLAGASVALNGAVSGAHALSINSSGATVINGAVQTTSLATDTTGSLAINGGNINTTGAQRFGERAVLGSATTLNGSNVTLLQGAQGPALSITGNAGVAGEVATTGAQTYGAALQLLGDTVLAGASVALNGAVSGAHALSINSSGATVINGAVQTASLTTDTAGSLAINGGSITTTGAQSFGERAVLGANTTLGASLVNLLGGVDGTTAGAQSLNIVGNAFAGGPIGAQQALASLRVSGNSSLAAGAISTTGDQHYQGAVQLLGDQQLRSTAGNLTLASTVDSSGRASLDLASDAGAAAVAGAVGGTGVLGALTVNAATTLEFGNNIRAYRLQQTVGGQTRYLGTVWVDGSEGIRLRSGALSFEQGVTATTGALNVALSSSNGTLRFAPTADISTATGFTQSGGAAVVLPASVRIDKGPLTLAVPATLPAGTAHIETEGDITLPGLSAPGTALTLAAGHGRLGSVGAGRLLIGQNEGVAPFLLDVASLLVPDAGSAQLFGAIAGWSGAYPASLVRGGLVNAPYFANGTPWGPLEIISRLVSTTVPKGLQQGTPEAPLPTVSTAPTAPTTLPTEREDDSTKPRQPSSAAPVLTIKPNSVNTTGAP